VENHQYSIVSTNFAKTWFNFTPARVFGGWGAEPASTNDMASGYAEAAYGHTTLLSINTQLVWTVTEDWTTELSPNTPPD
jgi:hypothetical protein